MASDSEFPTGKTAFNCHGLYFDVYVLKKEVLCSITLRHGSEE